MTPAQIAEHRKTLGLSKREFESALGYNREGKTTEALESGFENGKPFKITGAAEKALFYLLAIKEAYEMIGTMDYFTPATSPAIEAEEILRKVLPEALK